MSAYSEAGTDFVWAEFRVSQCLNNLVRRVTTMLYRQKKKRPNNNVVCVAGCSGLPQRDNFKVPCRFSHQRPQVSRRSVAVQIFAERVASVAVMILLTLHRLMQWSQTSTGRFVPFAYVQNMCRHRLVWWKFTDVTSMWKSRLSQQKRATDWKIGHSWSRSAVSSSEYIVSDDGVWWIISWERWARKQLWSYFGMCLERLGKTWKKRRGLVSWSRFESRNFRIADK
jgi:hypothetical protein